MRDIKFRIWHDGRMLAPNHNVVIDAYDGEPYWLFGFDEPRFMNDAILMQYTGLKDKNGVEIYENDLVQILDNVGAPHTYQIKWKPDVYAFVGEGGPGEWLLLEEFEGCELVGNVYENPQT